MCALFVSEPFRLVARWCVQSLLVARNPSSWSFPSQSVGTTGAMTAIDVSDSESPEALVVMDSEDAAFMASQRRGPSSAGQEITSLSLDMDWDLEPSSAGCPEPSSSLDVGSNMPGSSAGNLEPKVCGPHGLRPPPRAHIQCPAENLGRGDGVALAKRGRKVSMKTKKVKVTAKAMATAEPAGKTSSKKEKTKDKKASRELESEAVKTTSYDRKKEYCKERYALLHEADNPQLPSRGELTPRQSFIRQRLRTLIDEHKAQGCDGPTPSAKTFWARVTAEWHASTKAEKSRLEAFDREVLAEAAEPQMQPTPAVAGIVKSEPIAPVPVASLGGSSGSPRATAPNPRGQGGVLLRRAAKRRITAKRGPQPAELQNEEAEVENVPSTAAVIENEEPDVQEMCLSDLA